MRLLIVTQAVDENDPVLGFFCGWLAEFSKRFETITVVALREGKHHLPSNVSVHALGIGRSRRLFRYWQLLFSLRKEYAYVFVHMSPEFVIAGAPVWLLLGKKTTLWYNHTQKSFRLWLAAHFVQILFHTSPYAASARFSNSRRMPAGIDTELFKPVDVPKNPLSVYFQGRVAPAKRVDEICEAVSRVRSAGMLAMLTVVGPEDATFGKSLREKFSALIKGGALAFLGPKKPADTPVLYSAARVSINLTAAGNYDKTVLESMACETPAIVSSPAFADIVSEEWIVPEHDNTALADRITRMLKMPEKQYRMLGASLRKEILEKHALPKLASELSGTLALSASLPGFGTRIKDQVLLLLCTFLDVFTAPSDPGVPVFVYHSISQNRGRLSVSPGMFERQLHYLHRRGYTSLLPENLERPESFEGKQVMLTFDDGYRDNYTEALPLVRRFGYVGTVFVVTKHLDDALAGVDRLSFADAESLVREGWRIANHSHTHLDFDRLSLDGMREEYRTAKARLARIKGNDGGREYFAFPHGKATREAADVLRAEGAKRLFTTERRFARSEDAFLTPRIDIGADVSFAKFKLYVSPSFHLLRRLWKGTLAVPGAPVLRYITLSRMPTEKAYGHQIAKMCEAFAENGVSVELLAPTAENPIPEDFFAYYRMKKNFTLRRIPITDFLDRMPFSRRLGYVLRACAVVARLSVELFPKGTVVYTRHPSVCALMAWKGVRVVYECHERFGRSRTWSLWLLRSHPRIVTMNRFTKEKFVAHGFPPERILVATNGVDLSIFDLALSKSQALKKLSLDHGLKQRMSSSFVLLYTGSFRTMGQEKGIEDILKALTELGDTPVFFLAVGGSAADREFYETEARRLGVADHASFIGRVSAEELAVFQKASDTLLMPFPRIAHYEYFMTPLKLFEYMAAERPIIASNLPSIREVLTDESALFVPPDDPRALARAIRSLAEKPERGAGLAARAAADAKQYTWERRARSIQEWASL
jgi:glycosyltransferase involved in cell wall biosynthesis/peptidoglycan/xylan/chitin deacetylase (PgdA/CDA1 family)